MEKYYKELYLTNEPAKALIAKSQGKYVVLCLPLIEDLKAPTLSMSDYPYCLEHIEEVETQYLDKILLRFQNKPVTIAETDKLILREITLEDVPFLYEIYEDLDVVKNMDALYPLEEELSYTKDYIRCQYGYHDFGMWVICEKATGKRIGRAGLDFLTLDHIKKEENSLLLYGLNVKSFPEEEYPVELGFVMHKDYRRQGLTKEICQIILEYAKENMPYAAIYARVKADNIPSIKLLEKLGFSRVFLGDEV